MPVRGGIATLNQSQRGLWPLPNSRPDVRQAIAVNDNLFVRYFLEVRGKPLRTHKLPLMLK